MPRSAKGKIKGPLHGVPMTIKDSFDTAGVVSTGGTLGRKTFVPGKDATSSHAPRGWRRFARQKQHA